MWLWVNWHCKLVHTCMVYTELAPRWQQCHMAPAMQQANSVVSTPLLWILKHYKRIQSFIQNHMRHEHAESARKQRITLYKWSITHRHTHTHTNNTHIHTHTLNINTNQHPPLCLHVRLQSDESNANGISVRYLPLFIACSHQLRFFLHVKIDGIYLHTETKKQINITKGSKPFLIFWFFFLAFSHSTDIYTMVCQMHYK